MKLSQNPDKYPESNKNTDEIDLIRDNYTRVKWPKNKIHSNKFPYLLVRLTAANYSIITPQKELIHEINSLINWASDFARTEQFRCCLILSESRCYYFDINGDISESNEPPSGGFIVNWELVKNGSIKFFGQQVDAKRYYDQFMHSVNKGAIEEALGNINIAIELDKEFVDAYFQRGILNLKLNRRQEAFRDFTTVVELHPDCADAYYHRAHIYGSSGKFQQALKDINTAIGLNSSDERYFFERGVIYQTLSENKKAIKDFSQAIEINNSNSKAYSHRGSIYCSLKNYKKAVDDFGKALELNPENALAYYSRGYAYMYLSNREKAFEDFKMAARLGDHEAQELLSDFNIEW